MGIGASTLRHAVGLLGALIFAVPSFPQAAPSQFDSYQPQFEQLNQSGRWQDMERLARQVVSLAQSGRPADVVRADAWLIRALKAQGRFADAEAVARDALSLSVKTSGPDAADSLNVEASLGEHDGGGEAVGTRADDTGFAAGWRTTGHWVGIWDG